MMFVKIVFLLFVLFFTESKCKCRQSYMTFCDDINDLSKYQVENWTELVVGTEDADSSALKEINSDSLLLYRFEKLTTLFLVRQVKDIKTYTFALDPEDTMVDNLIFYGNEINRIKFSTFDAMILRKLGLANNSIEYIHTGVFYNCRIKTIDLSNNNLEVIEKEVFSDDYLIGNATKELNFRNNKIKSIQPASFPSSLEILKLDWNDVEIVHHSIYQNLPDLQELTVSHNRVKSLVNLKFLKGIRVLDFSHNKIFTLNTAEFNELKNLEVLDLSHNRINYPLSFNKFNFPQRHPSLQISLAFNKLTHLVLEDDSFRHHIVFLYGNPWDCKCLTILEKFMAEKNVKRNKCDLQFFGTGQVPYCIDLSWNDCASSKGRSSEFTTSEIENFLNVIEKSESVVKCRLSPKQL